MKNKNEIKNINIAIDSASHHIGICYYDIDNNKLDQIFHLNFDYEDKTFCPIKFVKFLKTNFKELKKQVNQKKVKINNVIMESQFVNNGTVESSIKTLHCAFDILKHFWLINFGIEIIEIEPIVWKSICSKYVLKQYISYADKQAWFNIAKQHYPEIETEDESDSVFIMVAFVFVDNYIKKNNQPFGFYTNTFTISTSINQKTGGLYKIVKTNNKN